MVGGGGGGGSLYPSSSYGILLLIRDAIDKKSFSDMYGE
jgi:hypothetical protein